MPARVGMWELPDVPGSLTRARRVLVRPHSGMSGEDVHGQAVGLALHVNAQRSSRSVVIAQALEDRVGHHDLTGLRAPFEPSSRVDNVADRREVLDRLVADIPNASDPEVDPDTDRQRSLVLASRRRISSALWTITSQAFSRSEGKAGRNSAITSSPTILSMIASHSASTDVNTA